MKATLYTYSFYGTVPSLVGVKLAQVFTYWEFKFVAPMKSKSDGGLGLIYICGEHGVQA